MLSTITNVEFFPEVALVTVNNIPNEIKKVSAILSEMAKEGINIDMISQTAPYKDRINLSFTTLQDDLDKIISSTVKFKKLSKEISTEINGNNTKIIFTGEKMRDTAGVAAEVFETFANSDIHIKLVTTSEIEISCLIDIKDVEKAQKVFNKYYA